MLRQTDKRFKVEVPVFRTVECQGEVWFSNPPQIRYWSDLICESFSHGNCEVLRPSVVFREFYGLIYLTHILILMHKLLVFTASSSYGGAGDFSLDWPGGERLVSVAMSLVSSTHFDLF